MHGCIIKTMQPIFLDTRILDSYVREHFLLSHDIMMENAAAALERELCAYNVVVIFAGAGNNGADGYALARRIADNAKTVLVCPLDEPKSDLCKTQALRARSVGITFCTVFEAVACLEQHKKNAVAVDCIFGSGFHGYLPEHVVSCIQQVNKTEAFCIACDVPTGISMQGHIHTSAFAADITVTMGALKWCLFSDSAKNYVGHIVCADLGIHRSHFESCSECSPEAMLLEPKDLKLPSRANKAAHKGDFGHTAVIIGEKPGAAVIAASAALRFGSGLVTVVNANRAHNGKTIPSAENNTFTNINLPYDIMHATDFPTNTTAVAAGMGLGRNEESAESAITWLTEHADIPCVLDADLFYAEGLKNFLKNRSTAKCGSVVLTPHPKEFCALLERCELGTYTVLQAVEQRAELTRRFCTQFPGIVLVLKGAVVTIGVKLHNQEKVRMFINPWGTPALAKGGSGDVLSGLIAALLAQKNSAIDAACCASLAHALASRIIRNDFALTPFSLIQAVTEL